METNYLSYRTVEVSDLKEICQLPKNEEELFFMFPQAQFPLTVEQIETVVKNRFNSTVILLNEEVVAFANFYEAEEGKHCSIGNAVVSFKHRNQGIGRFLIEVMEHVASEQYNISELQLSCFNMNTKGILLYSKLGYNPYEIEQRSDKLGNNIALLKMKKTI